jgi:hypothetical protein
MYTMTNTTTIPVAILALVLSGYSVADDLTDAAEGLCDTIRSCALEAVAGDDLTDVLRQKMDPVLEGNCAQMRSRVQVVPPGNTLYQPAVNCLRSMESLSCPELHNAGEVKTPECTEYDRLAKEAGDATP